MTFRKFMQFFQAGAMVLVVTGALCPALRAQALPDHNLLAHDLLAPSLPGQGLPGQGPLPDAPTPFVEAAAPVVIIPSNLSEHKFWDKPNRLLCVTAAILNGADFAVTRANLQSGGQELNPVVRVFGRSTAGLAVNFIGETAGVISLSYFFHKTGHHKLERVVSLVNIGGSTGAVSYGLMHRRAGV